MTKQLSFSKFEHAVLPTFRNDINHAESSEDVKKFFVYTTQKLFEGIFAGAIRFEYTDIALTFNENGQNYMVSDRLLASTDFRELWRDSDLPNVVARLAARAIKRCKHLNKHPEKTDAKIRMSN